MKRLFPLVCFLGALLASGGLSHALSIPASEDTTATDKKITLAASTAGNLAVDPTHVALVYFNLDDIPKDTVVRFARLRLYMPSIKDRGVGIGVHRVTTQWNESAESAQPVYTAMTIGKIEAANLGSRRFVTVDVTGVVQSWIRMAFINEGFALTSLATGNRNIASASVTIAAKEGASLGLPAQLDIELGSGGTQGAQGPKGETGAVGAQGPKGAVGTAGVAGPTGPQGPIGPQGPKGEKGDAGNVVGGSMTMSQMPVELLNYFKPSVSAVYDASNKTFQATAVGVGTLSYQWLRENVEVAGATSAQLSAANLASGSYAVRVSNGVLSSVSASVLAAPVLPSLHFVGATDVVNISNFTPSLNSITVEALFMLDQPTGQNISDVYAENWAGQGSPAQKQFSVGSTGLGGFAAPNSNYLGGAYTKDVPITLNVWHHAAYVMNKADSTERLYVDGQLVGQRTTGSSSIWASTGGYCTLGYGWRGYLSSFRISNSARYVGDTYPVKYSKLTSDSNTLLLYNFSQISGSTITDESGNGRTGTIGGKFYGTTQTTSPLVEKIAHPYSP